VGAVLALTLQALPSDLRGDLQMRTDPVEFTGIAGSARFHFSPPRSLRVITPALQMIGARP
jgi:hypothetical protein